MDARVTQDPTEDGLPSDGGTNRGEFGDVLISTGKRVSGDTCAIQAPEAGDELQSTGVFLRELGHVWISGDDRRSGLLAGDVRATLVMLLLLLCDDDINGTVSSRPLGNSGASPSSESLSSTAAGVRSSLVMPTPTLTESKPEDNPLLRCLCSAPMGKSCRTSLSLP